MRCDVNEPDYFDDEGNGAVLNCEIRIKKNQWELFVRGIATAAMGGCSRQENQANCLISVLCASKRVEITCVSRYA